MVLEMRFTVDRFVVVENGFRVFAIFGNLQYWACLGSLWLGHLIDLFKEAPKTIFSHYLFKKLVPTAGNESFELKFLLLGPKCAFHLYVT